MKVEYLYNNKWNTSTFYIWNGMTLIDKIIFEGKMSQEEINKRKKTLKNSRNINIKETK